MSATGSCNVCKKTSTSRCSRCKSVFYCGAEHQKADWSTHSKQCKILAAAASKPTPSPSSWNPPKTVSAEKGKGTPIPLLASQTDLFCASFLTRSIPFCSSIYSPRRDLQKLAP